MARYNTVFPTGSASGAAAFTSPSSGLFTSLTGTSYTVTIGDPVLFAGQNQIFYNGASGSITVTFTSLGAGTFIGPGASGTTSQVMLTGTTLNIYSDGTNWVILGGGGGPVNATTGAFSGNITLTGATPTVNFNNTAPTIATNSASSTASIFNTNATTINMGGGATSIALGATTGTFTVNNPTITGSQTTQNVFNTNATTVNAFGAAQTLTIGNATGTATINNATVTLANATNLNINGANPSIVTSSTGTASVFNTGAVTGNLFGAATTITIGASGAGTATLRLTTASSTTGTGALVVAGGVGIAGQLTATTIVETSSVAFKENINPISNALDTVMQLVGVTYDRKDNKEHEAGLIAEEVYKIAPDLVSLDKDGKPYGIKYTKLGAYLLESIKSLKLEIESIKKHG